MAAIQRIPNSLTTYFCLPGEGYVQAKSLAAATAERIAIPPNAKFVLFQCTDNFCAAFGNDTVVAAMPTDIADGTANELNPTLRQIPVGATSVSVITDSAAKLTATFYLGLA
jgi:hypothetical protein